jgi:hypothetical protein
MLQLTGNHIAQYIVVAMLVIRYTVAGLLYIIIDDFEITPSLISRIPIAVVGECSAAFYPTCL